MPQLYNPLFFAAEGKLSCNIVVVALIAHEYINEHTGNTRVNRFIRKCLIKTAVKRAPKRLQFRKPVTFPPRESADSNFHTNMYGA